jgi:NAD(P)H-dependent FMN reductase
MSSSPRARAWSPNALTSIGASTGLFGAVWAQAETRKVLGALKAQVIDEKLPVGLSDEGLQQLLY